MDEVECKICGKKLKSEQALSMHLYAAHRVKKREYNEKYRTSDSSQNELQKNAEEQLQQVSEASMEQEKELVDEIKERNDKTEHSVRMKIRDVKWLDKRTRTKWVAVFEEDGIMQTMFPLAMGIIVTEKEQVPGLLIMMTDGTLVPPWIFESFKGIYVRKELTAELKAMEKRKRKEKKLQENIAKETKRASIFNRIWQSQKAQKQSIATREGDMLSKIKTSMDEVETEQKDEREDRTSMALTNPNVFNLDPRYLREQSSRILNFKKK